MILSTNICGINLDNPLLPGSGPLTGDAERILAIENTGVGALVTKTIAPLAAQVVRPCIVKKDGVIMNCESWSEFSSDQWIDYILPEVTRKIQRPLLASVGYNKDDYLKIVPKIDHLVQGYECLVQFHSNSGDYSEVGDSVRTFSSLTEKPIWVKMSGLKPDPVGFAQICVDAGAQGVVAITSLGPCMAIDIATRRPLIGLGTGYSWASGPAIKPLALSIIYTIKKALPSISIIGSGGIATAEDVIEFLLAGADAVEMLSTAMMKGIRAYRQIIEKLPETLKKYYFTDINQVKRERLTVHEPTTKPTMPLINKNLCTGCGLCERCCPYSAMQMEQSIAKVEMTKCFGCGLCQTSCPFGAISGVLSRM